MDIRTYTLKWTAGKDIYFENRSPMFPVAFKEKIDKLANLEITAHAEPLGGFFGNFINTFIVKSEYAELFLKTILKQIGHKVDKDTGVVTVWDADEENSGNEI